jgi:hypothetical protein
VLELLHNLLQQLGTLFGIEGARHTFDCTDRYA